MSGDQMTGPDAHAVAAYAHGIAANDALLRGDNAAAQVHAILALASAVDRIASIQEATVNKAVR
jgi:hypothetical protein